MMPATGTPTKTIAHDALVVGVHSSALGSIVGLAARPPLTMFDEAYLGMDAPTRRVVP
jgi:hypothetical protein